MAARRQRKATSASKAELDLVKAREEIEWYRSSLEDAKAREEKLVELVKSQNLQLHGLALRLNDRNGMIRELVAAWHGKSVSEARFKDVESRLVTLKDEPV